MENADTLVLLGTHFPYRAFYPAKAKLFRWISTGQPRRALCGGYGGYRGYQSHTQCHSAAPAGKEDRTHLDAALKHYQTARSDLDALATASKRELIHPQYLAKKISELADDDTVFTCDVGTPTVWAARYLTMNGKRRLIGSFNHGSMANAMAQAIGAQAPDRKRQVVAMCGDGGFSMLMGDFISGTDAAAGENCHL